ncbi:MAG: Fic family protein [Lachnospiraceae bacterium]|nr:Fic family protein [Lachnospiraceae bacterium]
MRDPYLYKNTNVLINKFHIKDQSFLNEAEADYVVFRLKDLALHPMKGFYDCRHFLKMHEFIFQDIFEWAGQVRTIPIYKEEDVLGGMSIEYSEPDQILTDIEAALSDIPKHDWKAMSHEEVTNQLCDTVALLWKIHPFREGNTRTTVTFCCQYADEAGLNINRKLFEDNAAYVRTALVAYNAYFSDGSDFSKKEYLRRIVGDALN